ncbi:glucose-6-phosphate dehydrogenase [Halobacillus salinarum]|uniref:Glucose-6-phosphate 1-dehydrogenase n=1 Tax=Halobacillus salinarum TaxID=2932257 RepID=A0ABY4EHS4_9BACI|nr:glucose-6-phosphate dehydrogenase [Halobacillus salinarum]UOQ43987.1 glucose-6-phosphate dehydrogenase [Halobacillus salinarum]
MDSMTFVLFGATGDLAKRKIYPALFNLYMDQSLPAAMSIIGLGRREWNNERLQSHVREAVTAHCKREIDEEKLQSFLEALRYCRLNITNLEDFGRLHDLIKQREEELKLPENRLFYLSVAPKFFEGIAANIKESGLSSTKGWRRLIIEKPFGNDLETARQLNRKLSRSFNEEEIFRIDHYLGKPMIQNLETLEFANPVLQSLWNNQYVSNVQITASETVGVEKRAGYYEHAGAVRDMLQNHMLQMLMMTAMHVPQKISPKDIREVKRKVMDALVPLNASTLKKQVVRGQYTRGEVDGELVAGYTEEDGVSSTSKTDTFVAAKLLIDNDFWRGVPFYLRTGKRLEQKSTRIVIEFKNPLKDLYNNEEESTSPNLLTIEINPNESITLQLNSKSLTRDGKIEPVHINFSAKDKHLPEAYELLIFDALKGDPTFFAHWNEVELSWKWIQPILEAFENDLIPLEYYEAGTMGPKAADQLVNDDGFNWW